jgi:DNA-directed RNA polymerase alpha subunit
MAAQLPVTAVPKVLKRPVGRSAKAAAAKAPIAVVNPMNFKINKEDEHKLEFTLSPIHVSYANTLRRLILTGIETVAFRSDMTLTGTTTDVLVAQNDTPMTNEMLADRIGLLPIHVKEPLIWEKDKYVFTLNVTGKEDRTTYVTASDFKIKEVKDVKDIKDASQFEINENNEEKHENEYEREIASDELFIPNALTQQTSLIAILQPSTPPQKLNIIAKASIGTGREHARFSPVSQCSYEYSLDSNEERIEQMFTTWLSVAKKIDNIDKTSEKYNVIWREFNTMQIKRCYLMNEKQQPYSYDFTIETIGTLPIKYIVSRACDVGENLCNRYVNIDTIVNDTHITVSPANSRIIGFDFLIRGQDHTLGNLLQTWLVDNHIEGASVPKITYAGYSVPHPLRDEIILRIGIEDGKEETARKALAAAARGCALMFRQMREAWLKEIVGVPRAAAPKLRAAASSFVPKVAPTAAPIPVTVNKLE